MRRGSLVASALVLACAADALAADGRACAARHKAEGAALLRAGRLEHAALAYRLAIAADPRDLVARSELGNVCVAQGKDALAVRKLAEALRLSSGYALARYNLAHALRRAARHREAVAAYRTYGRERPNDPHAHFGLGGALKAAGDGARAAASFERYVALEARASEAAWVDRAIASLRASRPAPAAAPAARAAAVVAAAPPPAAASRAPPATAPPPVQPKAPAPAGPSSAPAEIRAGEAAFRAGAYPVAASGNLRGAIEAWESVSRINPANARVRDLAMRARRKLGLVKAEAPEGDADPGRARRLLEAGRAAQALRVFDRTLCPGAAGAPALLGRAEALMALGRYREAARALLEAMALGPAAAEARYRLAGCHQRLGDVRWAGSYAALYLRFADRTETGAAERLREARQWAARGGR
jgi:tetratricopeptide (TPR) repeat protein